MRKAAGVRCAPYLAGMTITAILASSNSGVALGQRSNAMKKLAFLSGSWNCKVQGKRFSNSDVERLSYQFSPDWFWMIEGSSYGKTATDTGPHNFPGSACVRSVWLLIGLAPVGFLLRL